MWDLQHCIEAIKNEYPNHYPYAYVEYEKKYIFTIIPKGIKPEEALSDMHIVDPKREYVSGSYSIMELFKDDKFKQLWKHANLVSDHDKSLGHSVFSLTPVGRNWGIHKTKNQDFLMHHGIKGQQWGVQNGPPYPLDAKKHAKVVSQNAKSNKNEFDTKTGSTYAVALAAYAAISLLSKIAIPAYLNSKFHRRNVQERLDANNTELSKELIGDIADVSKQYSNDSLPRKIEGQHSIEDDMAACNPKYENGVLPGTSNNCALCAFTYDLRRRGYDVTSKPSSVGNYPDIICESLYEGAKKEHIEATTFYNLYKKAAKQYPEGARGEIGVFGPMMGHSMAWEIVNGELVVIDSQRNVKVSPKDLKELGFYPGYKQTHFIRTDNLKIKPEGISKVSAELKPNWKEIYNTKKQTQKENENETQKTLTEAERINNYEKLWKKEHPNAKNDADSREAMDKWVREQIAS